MDIAEALGAWWAPALAFAAGVVSFASPCVLPLVPGYLSFVSGGQAERGASGEPEERRRPVAPLLLFVLGLAVVFTALGAFSRVFVPVFRSSVGQRIAGVVVVGIGVLMILYAFRIGGARLYAERRPFLGRVRPGTLGALPLGMAFATGWTPCVGPVLAGIIGLAGAQGGGVWGAFLMFCYALGLGLPFLLVGLGLQRMLGALGFVKRNYRWFAGVGGALLITIGVLLVANLWVPLLSRLGLLRLARSFTPPI
ncbi:MAG TPA: cytochrome c biogenesis protein CcdA [Actinomycetota bacterium]|nr:cytochrome c biogenesis protein CcdA [Actinomycetota bacterium]